MNFPEPDQATNEENTADVSLITGALRTSCLRSSSDPANGSSTSSSLVIRNQTLTMANTSTAGTELLN